MSSAAAEKRYFCHQCDRTVSLRPSSDLSCPRCLGGFLEEFELPSAAAVPIPAPAPFDFLPFLSAILGADPDAPGNSDPEAFDPLAFLQSYLQALSADVELVFEGGPTGAAVGDYFVGPGLERLIEELAENDPNRYGTPPAAAAAVAALPDVRVDGAPMPGADDAGCAVCMEEFEPGLEAKRMPCGHLFHWGCLLPWLELHCSCPVCRHELPTDDPDYEGRRSARAAEGGGVAVGLAAAVGLEGTPRIGPGAVERRLRVSLPWPFGSTEGSSSGGSGDGRRDDAQGESAPETRREN